MPSREMKGNPRQPPAPRPAAAHAAARHRPLTSELQRAGRLNLPSSASLRFVGAAALAPKRGENDRNAARYHLGDARLYGATLVPFFFVYPLTHWFIDRCDARLRFRYGSSRSASRPPFATAPACDSTGAAFPSGYAERLPPG